MKNYKVTGHIAVLGVGMVLKLSNAQASIRTSSLKQKSKDIYIVLAPIQFKQGEVIVVVDGNVSKSVLVNLEDLSKKDIKQERKATKSSTKKKDKKSDANPPETPEEDDDPVNPDEDDSSDENLQPETDDEVIINDGNVNNLPVAKK